MSGEKINNRETALEREPPTKIQNQSRVMMRENTTAQTLFSGTPAAID
jgi:hypothetical protein